MFSLDEINKEQVINNVHSLELKNININKYKYLISNDCQLDIYTKYKNKINIIYSDILNYSDECLINPANEMLTGGGGIDGIVHDLGGKKLMEEINNIPFNNYNCRLLESEAVLTNGYNDKYKLFIHVVAPYYDDNNNLKYKAMEKTFDRIFDIISLNNIKSVTIPAIGTGFYGFHMYDYTIICFKKIIQFLEKNDDFKQITLITNNKLQYNYYNVIFNDYVYCK